MRRKEFNVVSKQSSDQIADSIANNQKVVISGLKDFLLIDLCEQMRENNKLLRKIANGKGKKK